MDDLTARSVVDRWSSGAGVVARGPKMLMSVVPATPGDVERHTGRTRSYATDLWRLEVGGRFLSSEGLVYPGGVPYPEELHHQTAVIANEVWLYIDGEGDVLGAYWWPDAVRRPIASVPTDDFPPETIFHPADASTRVEVPVPCPEIPPWEPAVAVALSRREVLVFCVRGSSPEPVNEMLIYEHGGVSVRARLEPERLDVEGFLRCRQPPYRRLALRDATALGRDPGRALGPQTWPWPGELRWWEDGVLYEVKGFQPLTVLTDLARSLVAGGR